LDEILAAASSPRPRLNIRLAAPSGMMRRVRGPARCEWRGRPAA